MQMYLSTEYKGAATGVYLSKLLGATKIMGQPKYWGGKMAITDKTIGISQLLGDVPGLLSSLCLWT